MDPNQIIREEWIDDPKLTGGRDLYQHVVLYADGREITTTYRRGTTGPDGRDQAVSAPSTRVVPDQKKAWDDQQREAQRQTDQAEKRVTGTTYETRNGKQVRVTRYEDGSERVDEVPSGEPKPAEPPKERVNPSDPARRERWDPSANNGQGAWVDAGPIATKTEESKPPQERVNPADPNRRQVWNPRANGGQGAWEDAGPVASEARERSGSLVQRDGRTFVVYPDGTSREVAGLPAERKPGQRSVVKGADGRTYVLTINEDGSVSTADTGLPAEQKTPERMTDKETGQTLERGEDGVWRPIKTEGVDSLPPAAAAILARYRPDPRKPAFGLYDLQQEVLGAVGRGELNNADARKLLATAQPLAQAEIDRVTGIESTQRDVFKSNIGQRNTDIAETQHRRASAGNAMQNAYTYARQFKLGPREMRYLAEMERANAEQWGGMREYPREQPYPMTREMLNVGLDGAEGPRAGPAPTAGQLTAPLDHPGYVLPERGVAGVSAPASPQPPSGQGLPATPPGQIPNDPRAGLPPLAPPPVQLPPGAAAAPATVGLTLAPQPVQAGYWQPGQLVPPGAAPAPSGGGYLEVLRGMPGLAGLLERGDPVQAILALSPLARRE